MAPDTSYRSGVINWPRIPTDPDVSRRCAPAGCGSSSVDRGRSPKRPCNETEPCNDSTGVNELPTRAQPDPERVYRGERLALVRLAMLLTGSREAAEDVVQTAFAASIGRWQSLDDPVAYLRRVVINQAKDHHRRRFRRLVPGPEPLTGEPVVDETWAEVRRLPARQRAVVVLRFYEDLPLTEIGALLGRPAGTVRSDLHRALDRLRRTLP